MFKSASKSLSDPLTLLRWTLLVVMVIAFTAMNSYFVAPGNLYSIVETFSLLGLVALGLALTMLAGEFDLSGGAMVAVSGLIMLLTGEQSAVVGLLAALAFGALVGLVNGLLALRLQVSSLVTTLGMMILLSGFAVWLEGGKAVSFANYDLTDAFNAAWLQVLSPRSVITIAAFVLIGLMLVCTRLGRDIIATGSQRKAARMAGARVDRALIWVFVISGLCSALAGALLAINLGRASSTFGGTLLLQAASAAILGGIALSGGIGRPFGVAIGVLVLAVLNNGLGLIGAASPVVLLLNGMILLIAVFFGGAPGAWIRSRLRPARARS